MPARQPLYSLMVHMNLDANKRVFLEQLLSGMFYTTRMALAIHAGRLAAYYRRQLVVSWSKSGKKHLIGQTELCAVVVARSIWAEYIDDSRCIFFIDHGGVMSHECLHKG